MFPKCLDLNSYMCVVFFGREYHDSLICFDAGTVGWMAEYAAVYLQRLEDARKPVGKIRRKFLP